VKNKGFVSAHLAARSASFLDRTVAARRPEKPFESATGIIPGDRGKVGDSWCRPPLRDRASGHGRQISPAPLIRSRVRSVYTNQELSGERRSETAREPSHAHRTFRPVRGRSYPEGFGCYCADQNAVAFPAGRPRQKARLARTSRARKGDATAGRERAWQSPRTSSNRGGEKNASPHCKSECNLRDKRSDP
jgi:hypothetical protein